MVDEAKVIEGVATVDGVKVIEGIITGGAGGFLAGITVFVAKILTEKYSQWREKERVYRWLKTERDKYSENNWKTKDIARWNNLTEDRARYICSTDKRILLGSNPHAEVWIISEHSKKSK